MWKTTPSISLSWLVQWNQTSRKEISRKQTSITTSYKTSLATPQLWLALKLELWGIFPLKINPGWKPWTSSASQTSSSIISNKTFQLYLSIPPMLSSATGRNLCGLILDIFLHQLWTSNVEGGTCPSYVKPYRNQQLVNLSVSKVTFYLWIALYLGD